MARRSSGTSRHTSRAPPTLVSYLLTWWGCTVSRPSCRTGGWRSTNRMTTSSFAMRRGGGARGGGRGGGVMGWEVLQEAHSGAGAAQTGHNASAQAAFRDRLQLTYGTIEA